MRQFHKVSTRSAAAASLLAALGCLPSLDSSGDCDSSSSSKACSSAEISAPWIFGVRPNRTPPSDCVSTLSPLKEPVLRRKGMLEVPMTISMFRFASQFVLSLNQVLLHRLYLSFPLHFLSCRLRILLLCILLLLFLPLLLLFLLSKRQRKNQIFFPISPRQRLSARSSATKP